ncbi:MAG TPA: hypothetical protein VK824_10875 [Planctomycetota bacterium]|nr:hypothetical protein [Planctomycetota bacterium]
MEALPRDEALRVALALPREALPREETAPRREDDFPPPRDDVVEFPREPPRVDEPAEAETERPPARAPRAPVEDLELPDFVPLLLLSRPAFDRRVAMVVLLR